MVAFRTAMLVQMRRRYKFEVVVTSETARDGHFPQCTAGADAVEGSRGGCFWHWNAGARRYSFEIVVTLREARDGRFPQQMWWREAGWLLLAS